jgi:hypothetical protein
MAQHAACQFSSVPEWVVCLNGTALLVLAELIISAQTAKLFRKVAEDVALQWLRFLHSLLSMRGDLEPNLAAMA